MADSEKHKIEIEVSAEDKLTKPLQKFDGNITELTSSVSAFEDSLKALERPFSALEKQADRAFSSIDRSRHKALSGLSSGRSAGFNLGSLGAVSSIGLSASKAAESLGFGSPSLLAGGGIAALTGAAVMGAASFEQEMLGVRAYVSGADAPEEFAKLRRQNRDLGRTLIYSPGEIAKGQQMLGRSGFDAKEVYQSVPVVMELAFAGKLEVEEAANIATGALGAYNLEADQTVRVADKLASASNNTKATLNSLSHAFEYAGGNMAQTNIDMSTGLALLGALSKTNIVGDSAGTGMSALIVALESAAGDENKINILKKAGLDKRMFDEHGKIGGNIYDSAGSIIGNKIVDTLNKLFEADNLTQTDLQKLFDIQGKRIFNALKAFGTDRIKELFQKIEYDSKGELKGLVSQLNQGQVASMEGLKSSLSDLSIAIGDTGLLSLATAITESTTDLINTFNNFMFSEEESIYVKNAPDGMKQAISTTEDVVYSTGAGIAAATVGAAAGLAAWPAMLLGAAGTLLWSHGPEITKMIKASNFSFPEIEPAENTPKSKSEISELISEKLSIREQLKQTVSGSGRSVIDVNFNNAPSGTSVKRISENRNTQINLGVYR